MRLSIRSNGEGVRTSFLVEVVLSSGCVEMLISRLVKFIISGICIKPSTYMNYQSEDLALSPTNESHPLRGLQR